MGNDSIGNGISEARNDRSEADLGDLPHWPRLLSLEEAARYVGVSVNAFKSRVGDLWPEPIRFGRRTLYDKDALDRTVDGLSRPARTSSAKKIGQGRRNAGGQVEAR